MHDGKIMHMRFSAPPFAILPDWAIQQNMAGDPLSFHLQN
jgi:hypothetical protein